jgi:hypothetical protein
MWLQLLEGNSFTCFAGRRYQMVLHPSVLSNNNDEIGQSKNVFKLWNDIEKHRFSDDSSIHYYVEWVPYEWET